MSAVAPAIPRDPLQQAVAFAESQLDPQRQAIQQAIQAAEADRVKAAQAAEGVIRAVGELSAGDAEAIRQAWAQGADRMAGVTSGLTGNLRDLAGGAAAEAAATIARLSGIGEIQSLADPAANVAQFIGAQPVDSMGREAARGVAQALAHRQAGGLAIADRQNATDYSARQGIQGLRDKLLEVEAKRPGTILEAWMAIRGQENQERATNVQIGTLQLQMAKSKQDEAVAMTNLTGTVHVVKNGKVVDTGRPAPGSQAGRSQTTAQTAAANRQAANQRAAASRLQSQAAQLSKDTGYVHKVVNGEVVNTGQLTQKARNDQRIQSRADKAAQEIRAQRQQPGGGKPPTREQISAITARANLEGRNAMQTLLDRIWQNTPNTDAKRAGESDKAYQRRIEISTREYKRRLTLNFGALMAEVIQTIGPHLRILDYSQAQIRQVARRIVTAQVTPPKGK